MSIIDHPYDESYPPSLWLGADPHIDTLSPATGSAAGGPFTVTITGTDFDANSVVEVNQAEQPTTYVSATELTISYDPSVTGTALFTVRRGSQESNSMPFVVTTLDLDGMTVAEVQAWVDDDGEHAQLADEVMAQEQEREQPRVTLLDWLRGFIAHRDEQLNEPETEPVEEP